MGFKGTTGLGPGLGLRLLLALIVLTLISNSPIINCGKPSSSSSSMMISLPTQYGLMSTLRVIKRLCTGGKLNPWVAQKFFDCYDAAPKGGKEIYVRCQKKSNGYILNTPENIQRTCMELYKFPQYGLCLTMEFTKAKINMNTAVDRVNACEEKILGINSRSG